MQARGDQEVYQMVHYTITSNDRPVCQCRLLSMCVLHSVASVYDAVPREAEAIIGVLAVHGSENVVTLLVQKFGFKITNASGSRRGSMMS
ncbi:hypothetical protein TNCV_2225841 [Trichonephila clavipes]|nr:hypothetical protein TNCV_2225841 [Trichonephila clavipes]